MNNYLKQLTGRARYKYNEDYSNPYEDSLEDGEEYRFEHYEYFRGGRRKVKILIGDGESVLMTYAEFVQLFTVLAIDTHESNIRK